MNYNKSIFYMIISALAFALMNLFVKYLEGFSVYQIVFFRAIGTLAFTIPLILKQKIPFLGSQKKLLLIRAVVGVISLTSFFLSLNHLAVGTAVSLRYTAPIFAAILAVFLLKEKIKPLQWILFLIAFLGVLIIKGFGEQINTLGLVLIFVSAISNGLVFVLIRKIGKQDSPLVIINYFMLTALIFGGLMSISNWKTPSQIEWLILLSLGVFGYVGQLYMTKAFQTGKTSIVAPFKYVEVIFTIAVSTFWFLENYSLMVLLGIAIIIIALISNTLYASKK
ncbi:DMT family transporter [uncultured Olleya sp.]|uniref:DMT family transporter n=1 Tax=uncultured Olleya sp. TaxID=757243 RepID=UPI00259656E2|nr:DMT family transporter [uncultured Olleya sp.]